MPRSAALAVIVAVIVAVGITTTGRPVYGWGAAAAADSVAQLINHLAAPQVPSADLLTTQNYLDALCGAVVLAAFALTIGSALGLAALYRIRLNGTPHLGKQSDSEPP
ncbi:hypothetical protein [Nocardia asiatica]|uniref:hypothetical protein n=1 Tax=Nocardia asiatica TaxID=209252 RepID=UPI002457DB5C|nr:hypothetical protein [Nocardia asiatica]